MVSHRSPWFIEIDRPHPVGVYKKNRDMASELGIRAKLQVVELARTKKGQFSKTRRVQETMGTSERSERQCVGQHAELHTLMYNKR